MWYLRSFHSPLLSSPLLSSSYLSQPSSMSQTVRFKAFMRGELVCCVLGPILLHPSFCSIELKKHYCIHLFLLVHNQCSHRDDSNWRNIFFISSWSFLPYLPLPFLPPACQSVASRINSIFCSFSYYFFYLLYTGWWRTAQFRVACKKL